MKGFLFIFLLSDDAVLPGSDAGSDSIEPELGFVIQNCQSSCSMWCLMYGVTWSAVCEAALCSQFDVGMRHI